MRIAAAMLSSVILSAMLAGCGGLKPAQTPENSSAITAGPVIATASAQVGASDASPSSFASVSSPSSSALATSPCASASPVVSTQQKATASASPKSTADLQGESQQALDDLQQALKELDDMNKDTGAQSDINGLN